MYNPEFIDERELNANATIKDLEPLSPQELAGTFDRVSVHDRDGQRLLRLRPLGGGSIDFSLIETRTFALKRNSEVVVLTPSGRSMTFQMAELRTPQPKSGT